MRVWMDRGMVLGVVRCKSLYWTNHWQELIS